MRESQRNQAIRACEASFNTAIMSCPAWQGTVLAGSIVPDANTATSVSVGLGGRQTVNIAPAVGGVSNVVQRLESRRRSEQHRHQRAHDRQPGHQHEPVDYPGQPQCPRVLGPRANVILANPNGVTVDGGSFTNTGHVVPSTGKVSFSDLTIATGVMQRSRNHSVGRGYRRTMHGDRCRADDDA